MASSSNPIAAAATTSSNYYDVFLSHRGPDVKKTLATHLYKRLIVHGLRVFLDKEELEVGDHIPSQLKAAILSASVHIAIFSTNYAESSWCLNELLSMLESRKTIVPIFYGVKPDVLRWTLGGNGVYAQHLSILEGKKTIDPQSRLQKPRYDPTTIQQWRSALSHAADLMGFVVEAEACNSDDSQLVDEVVERVLKELPKTPLNVSKYPTGLDDKVRDFERSVLMPQQSGETRVVGIVGLGGVGKTTLAKEYFNRERSKYHRSCFLLDIREKEASKSLDALLSTLVKELTGSQVSIDNVDQGIEELRRRVSRCSSHALIILDDVDHIHQLNVLLFPVKDALSSGSLILVTSRNKDVLTSFGIVETSIYKLEGLNPQHSQELFCSHAFGQPHPAAQFEPLVKEFLGACQGLPLSLQVIGALLHGKDDLEYWNDQLHKISKILPEDIQNILKISYDGLDPEEKKIFLDIACFFTGEMEWENDWAENESIYRDRDTAIRVWDGSGLQGRLGLRNLQNRCLVDVVEGKGRREKQFLRMHDHLRDLGRHLAEKEPLDGHRLWQPTWDLLHNLCDQSAVRGLDLFHSGQLEECRRGNRKRMLMATESESKNWWSRLELLITRGDCLEEILTRVESPEYLIWLHCDSFPFASLPHWIPMERLSVLNVLGNKLSTLWEESKAPLQLRQLDIRAPLLKFPKSIGQLRYLDKIVVTRSVPTPDSTKGVPLKTLPDEFCNLLCLQHLELDYFFEMETLPESFGNLENLQRLHLFRCHKLRTLPNSFGNLIRLKHLSLTRCHNLTMSSGTLGNITTLEVIDLTWCHKIEVLPHQVAHQQCLSQLLLEGTIIPELPSAIANLRALEILLNPWLKTLPAWLGSLRSLKELKINGPRELKCLPDSMRELTQLEKLNITWTSVECLPPWIMALKNLVQLRVEGNYSNYQAQQFSRLARMPKNFHSPLRELQFNRVGGERETGRDSTECMVSLQYLILRQTGISEVAFGQGVCPNLQYLHIQISPDLVEVGTLPNSLLQLHLRDCARLEKIGGLCGLGNLKTLKINKCPKVEELSGLGTLRSLERLHLYKCGVAGILDFQHIANSPDLVEVGTLPNSLLKLQLWDCPRLEKIEGLCVLTKLIKLKIKKCPKVEELSGLGTLRSLERLHLHKCGVARIVDLQQLTNLRVLKVLKCRALEELAGIEHSMLRLTVLAISGCPNLRGAKDLRQRAEELPQRAKELRKRGGEEDLTDDFSSQSTRTVSDSSEVGLE